MPLGCHGSHNWTDPYYQRAKVAGPSRLPITRLHLVQRCLACDEVREVYPDSRTPVPGRIRRYEVNE